jgi:hypothetical protein
MYETGLNLCVRVWLDAMDMIFESFESITPTENHIKQLHGVLLKYSKKDEDHRGHYKKVPNHVEAFGPDGKSLGVHGRFTGVAAAIAEDESLSDRVARGGQKSAGNIAPQCNPIERIVVGKAA